MKTPLVAANEIQVEISGRHIHLSLEHIDALFQKQELTLHKELSQPKQYVCEERVSIAGPKGEIHNVALLWPPRKRTQVEISRTDALMLGLCPPVRTSGDLDGSEDIWIRVDGREVLAVSSTIIAKRHLHLFSGDCANLGVHNGDKVMVRVAGERSLIFCDVDVRADDEYVTSLHIDYDEGNAGGCTKDSTCVIWR